MEHLVHRPGIRIPARRPLPRGRRYHWPSKESLPISTAISSRCPAVADIKSPAWQKFPLKLLILPAQEKTGQLAVYVAVVQIFDPKNSNIYNYYISFLIVRFCIAQYNNCCVPCDKISLVDLVRSSVDLPPVV